MKLLVWLCLYMGEGRFEGQLISIIYIHTFTNKDWQPEATNCSPNQIWRKT